MKIIFAGTPEFARESLQLLINSPHQVIAVFTQPDRPKGRGQSLQQSPVKQLAERHQIPIYQPLSLRNPEIQATIRDLNPDMMVVAAYGLILPKVVLEIPKYGCVNVHASLLPRWRGASPIQHALLANDALTGITIMQMDVGLDTGAILSMYPCTIEKHETSETLTRRLATIGANILRTTIEDLAEGKITPIPQEDQQASLAPKISKHEAKIDWTKSAVALDCQIRAFNPWPVAYSNIVDADGMHHTVRIFAAEPLEEISQNPGSIVDTSKAGIDVVTGLGILRITELQLPGGKRLSATQVLNSKSDLFSVGARFGQ
jgi:methionyl-tRNA formyltransferase